VTLYDELVRTTPCKLCSYIESRGNLEQQEWERLLKLPEVSSTKVVNYLRVRGVALDEASVRRHRAHASA